MPLSTVWAALHTAFGDRAQERQIVLGAAESAAPGGELDQHAQRVLVVLGPKHPVAECSVSESGLDLTIEGCLPNGVIGNSETSENIQDSPTLRVYVSRHPDSLRHAK
jgi:hypothetical protein